MTKGSWIHATPADSHAGHTVTCIEVEAGKAGAERISAQDLRSIAITTGHWLKMFKAIIGCNLGISYAERNAIFGSLPFIRLIPVGYNM